MCLKECEIENASLTKVGWLKEGKQRFAVSAVCRRKCRLDALWRQLAFELILWVRAQTIMNQIFQYQMDFSPLAQALLKKMTKFQPTVWFFSFQKASAFSSYAMTLVKIWVNNILLRLSEQKWIMGGTFPSSTLFNCSLYLSLSCRADGELTMGRALNFLRFQIKMVGEMIVRWTQWGEVALSSSKLWRAEEQERAWEEQKPW